MVTEADLDAIHAINWSDYTTAYGSAAGVPQDLIELFLGGSRSLKAASRLWADLCHQHAYVSSAALPAFEFILLALESASESLQIELLDILLGFANCTLPGHQADAQDWKLKLHEKMLENVPRIRPFASAKNQDVREFAELILESLTDNR